MRAAGKTWLTSIAEVKVASEVERLMLVFRGGWRASWLWRAALGVAAAVLLVGLDAFWWEPSSLSVVSHRIEIVHPNAVSLDGLRIAVISDIHAGAPFIDAAKIEKLVHLTNREKPDLILLAGDYLSDGVVSDTIMPIEEVASLLKPLHARLGVYAVIGSCEGEECAKTIRALARVGITSLEDKSLAIHDGKRTIYLGGIGVRFGWGSWRRETLSAIPEKGPGICLTHWPDYFPDLPTKCTLTVAGHTHGGQVYIPLVGRPIVLSKYEDRYAEGLVVENGRYLFVTPGIGTSILAVRFLVPPEISMLEIHAHP